MNDVVSLTGALGYAVIALAAAVAWWSARPLVVGSALRRSGENQARVRGRGALEAFARLDTLVIDPIGSITDGEPRVVGVEPIDPEHDRSLRWFAGALQHGEDDPVAKAVSRLAGRGGATNVQRLPGIGVLGTVDRHPVRVGSPEWIGVEAEDDGWGKILAVEVDGRAMGRITVADAVRDQAPTAVAALVADGYQIVLAAPGEAAARHLAGAVPGATVVSTSERSSAEVTQGLRGEGRQVGSVGRARNPVAIPTLDAPVVTDALAPEAIGVEMTDVAIHHVAAVLRLLRGARGRLRSMRQAVLVVAAAGFVALLFTPTGPPDIAATSVAVLAMPAALAAPLARWS
ncbi:MAG: HAD family hydrolase [Aeromicrobium sp.]|uniref:HAD family hydrolase n=1 Tax=Aeromicrobium sp. TaxID=1871063 RepID=UPI00262BF55B|nr:HAD family hydrolase [Aeromicrobium sp.]MDF1705598.1 HAD family hydrolase [Aeromicrobium sp.]